MSNKSQLFLQKMQKIERLSMSTFGFQHQNSDGFIPDSQFYSSAQQSNKEKSIIEEQEVPASPSTETFNRLWCNATTISALRDPAISCVWNTTQSQVAFLEYSVSGNDTSSHCSLSVDIFFSPALLFWLFVPTCIQHRELTSNSNMKECLWKTRGNYKSLSQSNFWAVQIDGGILWWVSHLMSLGLVIFSVQMVSLQGSSAPHTPIFGPQIACLQ